MFGKDQRKYFGVMCKNREAISHKSINDINCQLMLYLNEMKNAQGDITYGQGDITLPCSDIALEWWGDITTRQK